MLTKILLRISKHYSIQLVSKSEIIKSLNEFKEEVECNSDSPRAIFICLEGLVRSICIEKNKKSDTYCFLHFILILFKEFIKEKNIESSFLSEYSKYRNDIFQNFDYFYLNRNMDGIIDNPMSVGFLWANSTQGFDFWKEKNIEWLTYFKNKIIW